MKQFDPYRPVVQGHDGPQNSDTANSRFDSILSDPETLHELVTLLDNHPGYSVEVIPLPPDHEGWTLMDKVESISEEAVDTVENEQLKTYIDWFDDPFVRHYIAFHERRRSDGTLETYSRILDKYLDYLSDERETSLLRATKWDANAYLRDRGKEGCREGTMNLEQAVLRVIHDHILKWFDEFVTPNISRSALPSIEFVPGPDTPPDLVIGGIERDEMSQLLDKVEPGRNKLMVRIGYECGLRNEEIRTLKVDDFTYREGASSIEVCNAKGNKLRTVPVLRDLAFRLDRWVKAGRPAMSHAVRSDYLFPKQKGEYLKSNQAFNEIVKKAANDAGVQGVLEGASAGNEAEDQDALGESSGPTYYRITAHTLRHTCKYHMVEDEVSRTTRMAILGHSDDGNNVHEDYGKKGRIIFPEYREKFRPAM